MNNFSFVDKMKKETWKEHEDSKESPFAKGIMGGELGVRGFVEWQRALYPIYDLLEEILKENHNDPVLHVFDHRKLDRTKKIYNDLASLGADPIKDKTKLESIHPYPIPWRYKWGTGNCYEDGKGIRD
jgi:heme oxygenase